MPRPAGAATDSASNALDEEDDETLIVTVQISRRLHPQLFDDVTRAKNANALNAFAGSASMDWQPSDKR